MSHAATNWAIQQRGLKPATKIVLWHLCDRHNPDFGCFPTQARLAEDAEMSISALNEHLATLEDLGLIHRIRAHDPHNHRRLPTRYILGFEQGFPQKPPPESGEGFVEIMEENDTPSPESADRAISGFPGVPSPDFPKSHLRNPEYNLVREPLTKLGRVDVHRSRMTVDARALKLVSVLQHLVAIPLYSLSFPKKFSIRCRHL